MNALLLLTPLLTAQIPPGVTVKNLFDQNGAQIARSVEIRGNAMITGTSMRTYFSRTVSMIKNSGTIADIESWVLMDGTPIKAIYRCEPLEIVTTFPEGLVRFETWNRLKRKLLKVTELPIPKDKPVLLSQFDPMLLTRNLEKDKIDCLVVTPEAQQAVECTLKLDRKVDIIQGGEVRKGLRFVFEGLKESSYVTLDEDWTFVRWLSQSGVEAKVDRWRKTDEALFQMRNPLEL